MQLQANIVCFERLFSQVITDKHVTMYDIKKNNLHTQLLSKVMQVFRE